MSGLYPEALSKLTIGRTSNAGFPVDVVGDINFSGTLRSNGAAYVGSQFITVNSNVYLPTACNLGIGKSNAAYALDVVGEINASSNIRIAGQSLQGLGVPTQVVFTSGSNATWTVPTGVTAVQVELVGGGGSGGNSANTSPYGSSGGGGAGGYFRLVLNSTLASSLSYGVGAAGNNTTVTYNGYTYTATAGGAGGINNVSSTYPGVGGVGGVPSFSANTACLSALVVNGGDGQAGGNLVNGTSSVYGGTGGASYFGSGSKGGPAGAAAANATAYGSGGGGGGNSTGTGGAGAPGVVIITYFTQSGLPTNYTATAPLSMSGTTLTMSMPKTIHTTYYDIANSGSNVSIPADVTNFSAKITPTYSTSKILVYVSVAFGFANDSYPYVVLKRTIGGTSTIIGSGTNGSGSQVQVFLAGTGTNASGSTEYRIHQASREFMDQPSTTSEITYQIQLACPYGTGYINRQGVTPNNPYIQFPASCITLKEVF